MLSIWEPFHHPLSWIIREILGFNRMHAVATISDSSSMNKMVWLWYEKPALFLFVLFAGVGL
jgi:hypothetical protein